MTRGELDTRGGRFELMVSIPVSLDEAETIVAVLDETDQDHLAAHVRYCIQEAKQKAGYLTPARGPQA